MSEMHREHMLAAIRLAEHGVRSSEGGPFGAIVARGAEVLGRGWNRVTSANDPTAHAEIVAIREACARAETFSLAGCEMYLSCEPCPMCLAAIYWARVDRVYYAATRHDAADVGFDDARIYDEISLSPDERQVPMTKVEQLRTEALQALHAWRQKEDRVPY